MAILTLIVAFVTLLVVCYQVRLMDRQQQTMNKQLDIMKKQDELLARRADLHLKLESRYLDPQQKVRVISFIAENRGQRSASNLYWYLLLPADGMIRSESGEKFPHEEDVQFIENVVYHKYRGFYKEPVYPGRELSCLHFRMHGDYVSKPMDVYWKLICEDGQFPPTDGMAKIHLLP